MKNLTMILIQVNLAATRYSQLYDIHETTQDYMFRFIVSAPSTLLQAYAMRMS